MRNATWITDGTVILPDGVRKAAIGMRGGKIVAIAPKAGLGARISARGRYVAPGFVDLHIWGDPATVAADAVKGGTTAFLTAIGPEPPEQLVAKLAGLSHGAPGAVCLGPHLEGPFLNPRMAGALPTKWMRPAVAKELRQLAPHAPAIRMITIAPEVPGNLDAIRQLSKRGTAVSIGHSQASDEVVVDAIRAGARSVTHVFNGMKPFHHRSPGVVGPALLDDRLTTMVILDGIHVGPAAFQLLLRAKGAERIVLETDSIRHQRPLRASFQGGAYYVPTPAWSEALRPRPTLAGSALTMIDAVRNAARFGKIPVADAVRMATANPARLVGETSRRGAIAVGRRADLAIFTTAFTVTTTLINGSIVYQR